MGLGKILKGIGKVGLGIGGTLIPGVGLASRIGRAAIPGLASAGTVAAGAASERGNARLLEDAANQQYDQTRLQGARLNLDAPSMRARTSVRGDILAGAQPLTLSGPTTGLDWGARPNVSGGLSPALLSGNSRALGQQMSRDALLSQMQGPAFTPTERPKPGKVDALLNTAGTVGTIANMANQFPLRRRPKIPQIPMGPASGVPIYRPGGF